MHRTNGFMIFMIIFIVVILVASIVGEIYLFKTFMDMPKEEVPNWVWFFLFWTRR